MKIEIDIKKLLGHIDAVGETNYDIISSKNIPKYEELIKYVVNQLGDNAQQKNDARYSVKEIGKASNELLKRIIWDSVNQISNDDFFELTKDFILHLSKEQIDELTKDWGN